MTLKITQECDYAIRILMMLSELGDEERADANRIATEKEIPQRFTVKILRKLVQGGLVQSFQGAKGGYRTGRAPEEITLKDVVWLIDGPIEINKCMNDSYHCANRENHGCPVYCHLRRINGIIQKELENIHFAALSCKEK